MADDDAAKWTKDMLASTGRTQVALGKYLGMSEAAISQRLSGHRPFRTHEFAKVKTFFGIVGHAPSEADVVAYLRALAKNDAKAFCRVMKRTFEDDPVAGG
jgi:predicted transcriptional regulator